MKLTRYYETVERQGAKRPKAMRSDRMLAEIIGEGIERGASDIFIEPDGRDSGRCRMAINGILRPSLTALRIEPNAFRRLERHIVKRAVVTPSDRFLPGDGRMGATREYGNESFRVSTMPVIGSRRIVLRRLLTSDPTKTRTP